MICRDREKTHLIFIFRNRRHSWGATPHRTGEFVHCSENYDWRFGEDSCPSEPHRRYGLTTTFRFQPSPRPTRTSSVCLTPHISTESTRVGDESNNCWTSSPSTLPHPTLPRQGTTTDTMSLTNCRFYEEKYPEIDSFVMVNVKQVGHPVGARPSYNG